MFREFVVAKRTYRDQFERDLTLAWHIEAFHRQKKLPSLRTVLNRQERQTVQQQKAALMMLSEQYRIPLKTRRTS